MDVLHESRLALHAKKNTPPALDSRLEQPRREAALPVDEGKREGEDKATPPLKKARIESLQASAGENSKKDGHPSSEELPAREGTHRDPAKATMSTQILPAVPVAGDPVHPELPPNSFTEKEMQEHAFIVLDRPAWKTIFAQVMLQWDGKFIATCHYMVDTGQMQPGAPLWRPELAISKEDLHTILADYLYRNCLKIPVYVGSTVQTNSICCNAIMCGALFPDACPMRQKLIQEQRHAWATSTQMRNKKSAFSFFANAIAWDLAQNKDAVTNGPVVPKTLPAGCEEFFFGD